MALGTGMPMIIRTIVKQQYLPDEIKGSAFIIREIWGKKKKSKSGFNIFEHRKEHKKGRYHSLSVAVGAAPF